MLFTKWYLITWSYALNVLEGFFWAISKVISGVQDSHTCCCLKALCSQSTQDLSCTSPPHFCQAIVWIFYTRWIDELFLCYGWSTRGFKPYFQLGPLSEILTMANLQHAASRIWTCAEPEFRLCWIKLCSSGNHYNLSDSLPLLVHLYHTDGQNCSLMFLYIVN